MKEEEKKLLDFYNKYWAGAVTMQGYKLTKFTSIKVKNGYNIVNCILKKIK